MLRIIFEGGKSDTERLELDAEQPPARVERDGERYGPVLDHYDRHMRDITGAWRFRVLVPFREMDPGHSALDVKP